MDFRMQLLGSLGGLDTTHLAEKCFQSARSLIISTASPADASTYLRDILSKSNIATCSRVARKYRYRLAAEILVANDRPPALQLLQLACRCVLDCLVSEQQPTDSEEFAVLCATLTASLAATQAFPSRGFEDPNTQPSKMVPAACTMLVEPLLNSIVRSATQETAACGHLALEGALGALAHPIGTSCSFEDVLAWTLRSLLHGMNSGSLRMALVHQAHRPLRQCLAGLGRSITPSAVRGCLRACLQGACHQESWSFRVEALQTLEALCEAFQVADGVTDDAREEDIRVAVPGGGVAALLDALPSLLHQIQALRYDKIAQVRNAYNRALRPLGILAADYDRSDVAKAVASTVAVPSHSTAASTGTPTASKRRHTFAASRSLSRPVNRDTVDADRPSTAISRPNRRALLSEPLDFGIRVFGPRTPPPRSISLPQQDINDRPEDCCQAKPSVDPPDCCTAQQQQPNEPQPQPPEQEQQCSRPASSPSPSAAAPQAILTSSVLLPHRHEAHRSESPGSCLVREASVQKPCDRSSAHCGDSEVLAGPVRIHVDADHRSFTMSATRMCGDVESIRCWMNVTAAPQDLGFEVCVPSHRPGISTTYRLVCKGGLMHQETVEGPTAGNRPHSLAPDLECSSSPSSSSSAPGQTYVKSSRKDGDIFSASAPFDSVTQPNVNSALPEDVCSPAASPKAAVSTKPIPLRKSLAWEVLL